MYNFFLTYIISIKFIYSIVFRKNQVFECGQLIIKFDKRIYYKFSFDVVVSIKSSATK